MESNVGSYHIGKQELDYRNCYRIWGIFFFSLTLKSVTLIHLLMTNMIPKSLLFLSLLLLQVNWESDKVACRCLFDSGLVHSIPWTHLMKELFYVVLWQLWKMYHHHQKAFLNFEQCFKSKSLILNSIPIWIWFFSLKFKISEMVRESRIPPLRFH